MSHLGELAKLSARDISGPLSELNERGRILGIIYETGNDGVHVEFWRQPTSKALKSLRHALSSMKKQFKSQQPKEHN